MARVSYDSRAVLIDGKRTLMLSGAIHYPRSTPEMWPGMMERSLDAGLNTVETYVFWNLHEKRHGVYDFSGRLDVRRFCEVAQEHGLRVILRIGPYICAETNYGGFPAWLRDVPGIRMRTDNEPFKREMAKWVRFFVGTMKGLFAPEGGPIILAQIENEYGIVLKNYGDAGRKYAQWAIDLGLSLDIGVPWVMCVGGAPGAIETINGFYGHDQVADHFANHPGQPALWTEAWTGWYDTWGSARYYRPIEDMAYGVARFIAEGGTGINYYMWHSGTNFGREGMFLQATHYYKSMLDEFGLATTNSKTLSRLHRVLGEYADVILLSARPAPRKLSEKQSITAYGSGERELVFLCNDDTTSIALMEWNGTRCAVPPKSVSILADGALALNTSEVPADCVVRRQMKPIAVRLKAFETWVEPIPGKRSADMPGRVVSNRPVEQLLLTHDESDYCWYSATMNVPRAASGEGRLDLECAGDVLHVFVDGKFAATSPVPRENRRGDGCFAQAFTLKLKPGRHELSILCCAIGLVKGDWMIDRRNMAEEKKGIWGGVRWQGRKIEGPWIMASALVGEGARLFAEGAAAVRWTRATASDRGKPLRWYRTSFDRPKSSKPLALDLGGMTKGLAWINEECIGRYWLAPGLDLREEWARGHVEVSNIGEPSQRYYHLPAEWLRERNTLTLFEEAGGNPATIRICAWQ